MLPMLSLHVCRIRTFAPPLNFEMGCQPVFVPSWNVQRTCHVSFNPGSLNCAVNCVGLPSSPGFGVVPTLNTLGATFLICRAAPAIATSGLMIVCCHRKSAINVYAVLKNVVG